MRYLLLLEEEGKKTEMTTTNEFIFPYMSSQRFN